MSYIKTYKWELVPENLPAVERKCPKCACKTHYVNTEKFRLNANKGNVDIWMIYQCPKCRSTWNMTIYERIRPGDIERALYERFMNNDKELAERYAFDLELHNKNRSVLLLDTIKYYVIQDEPIDIEETGEKKIEFVCKYPTEIRMDKLLGNVLGLSRSKIKNLYRSGQISCEGGGSLLKTRAGNGMTLRILI